MKRSSSAERLKKWPGGGAFAHPAGLTCGAFEQLLELGDGNLTAENRKIQMPGGLPGGDMLRLHIDRCITQGISVCKGRAVA